MTESIQIIEFISFYLPIYHILSIFFHQFFVWGFLGFAQRSFLWDMWVSNFAPRFLGLPMPAVGSRWLSNSVSWKGPEWTRMDRFQRWYFHILSFFHFILIDFDCDWIWEGFLVFAVRWIKRRRNKASSDTFWPRCTCAIIPAIPCAFHHDLRQWYQLWRSYETSFNDWDKVTSDLMQVRSLQEPFYSSTFQEFQRSNDPRIQDSAPLRE